jgi:hypothetical protein
MPISPSLDAARKKEYDAQAFYSPVGISEFLNSGMIFLGSSSLFSV